MSDHQYHLTKAPEPIGEVLERVVIGTRTAGERLGLHQGSVARRCRDGVYNTAQHDEQGHWEILEAEITREEMVAEVAAAPSNEGASMAESDDQPFPPYVECEHCDKPTDACITCGKASPGPDVPPPPDESLPPAEPLKYYYSRAAGETAEMKDRVMSALDEKSVVQIAFALDHLGNPIWKSRQVFGFNPRSGRLHFENGRSALTTTIQYVHK